MEGSGPPRTSPLDDAPQALAPEPGLLGPSWLISLVFHATLLLLVVITFKVEPRGARLKPRAGGGTSLDARDATGGELLTERNFIIEPPVEPAVGSTTGEADAAAPVVELAPTPPAAEFTPLESVAAAPPANPQAATLATVAIPEASAPPSIAAVTPTGSQQAGATSQTGQSVTLSVPTGGRGRTSVFGIEGVGTRFVYVFDRSGSMGGAGHNALDAAKAELLKSLESLDQNEQFQIIFYNERPTAFTPNGQSGKLVVGTAAVKLQATKFINAISADGGTQHESALVQGLKLRPDVLFFLTDGANPELSNAQMARIRQANGGTASINVVEFGLGPPLSSFNFLARLARENGGEYRYIDVTHLNSDP